MDIAKLQAACEKNGFYVVFAQTKKEALAKAKEFIQQGSSVGLGGSASVSEIGLLEDLISRKDIVLYNQYEDGITKEENTKRRKLGLTADIFVASANALTKEGELVNCDGEGNRVAAQIFGPDKVLLIIGINKLVNTIEDGLERIKNIASVKNAERLNKKAAQFGKEPNFQPEDISKKYTIIKSDIKGRIVIILVNEPLGY
jgi:L-lactate utilization protein LutB